MSPEHPFFEVLLATNNILVMVACAVLIQAFKAALPAAWAHPVMVRISRLIPIVLCVGGVLIPGVSEASIGEEILLGVVLGAFSGQFYEFVRNNLLRGYKKPSES